MPQVYIGVGSNLGEREKNIQRARDLVGSLRGVRITACAGLRETEPVGGPSQGKYLNTVWQIETDLPPEKLLERLLEIEHQLGRVRAEKNGPRTIDLDILFYGDEIHQDAACVIPHPRLHERAFVLVPLCDLDPEFIHPVLKRTVKELLNKLGATHDVQRAT